MNFDGIDVSILTYLYDSDDYPSTVYEICNETLGSTKKDQSMIDYRLQKLVSANIVLMARDPISKRRYFKINKENVYRFDNFKVDVGFTEVDYGETLVFRIDGHIIICHLEQEW